MTIVYISYWWCFHAMMHYLPMQFTMSGHTQLRGNAIMITSTITIVLFSTMVRNFTPHRQNCCCSSWGLLSFTDLFSLSGIRLDDQTPNKLHAASKILHQHDILWTIFSKILLHATSCQRAWSRHRRCCPDHSNSYQSTHVLDHPNSHHPPLLEKVRQCFHATCVWGSRFRPSCSHFSDCTECPCTAMSKSKKRSPILVIHIYT